MFNNKFKTDSVVESVKEIIEGGDCVTKPEAKKIAKKEVSHHNVTMHKGQKDTANEEAKGESKKDFMARQKRLAAASAETEKNPEKMKRLSKIPGYTGAMDLAKKTVNKEEITFKDKLISNLMEREMTSKEAKKKEEIVMAMKDKQDYFKKKYGKRWKEVMYATATKQAMKKEEYESEEELFQNMEQIDEKRGSSTRSDKEKEATDAVQQTLDFMKSGGKIQTEPKKTRKPRKITKSTFLGTYKSGMREENVVEEVEELEERKFRGGGRRRIVKKPGLIDIIKSKLHLNGEEFEGGVAEGAPELLKKEMPLHRHAEKLLAQNGVSKDDPDYHKHLGNTINHLRKFGNIDLINKQGMAEGFKVGDSVRHKDGLSGTVTTDEDKDGIVNWRGPTAGDRVSHSSVLTKNTEVPRWRKVKTEEVEGLEEGSSGAKYKVKIIGRDSKGDYYVSPSTGKKVYKSGVNRGDHEVPHTGEIKKKVAGEGFEMELDEEESGLRMAAHAANREGKKMFSFKGKTYPVKVKKEEIEEKLDPKQKTVDMLRGRVKVPASYDNEHKSAKVKLEGKQPEQDNLPFVPDVKQPENIKDKSGAVHSPMSRARHLARMAMAKLKKEMK